MKQDRARTLLHQEQYKVETLIAQSRQDAESDRAASTETGDIADPAERLAAAELDDTVIRGLKDRLDAIERAQRRLEDGTYGKSIRSGLTIPDARLEADPAAELTVEEALEQS